MTQPQAVHTFHSAWDAPRSKRGARGFTAAAVIIAAAHGLLIFYLYKSKIEPHFAPPQDEPVVIAKLFHPQTPPPPPPRPSQPLKSAPELRPHIANTPPPTDITQPEHLSLPPVQHQQDPVGPLPVTHGATSQPPNLVNPQFDRIPNADDLAQYYPERASRLGKQGDATIRCTVSAKGALTQCVVVLENPANLGFGDAALKLSKIFKLKPATADGLPLDGGVFSTKITFKLPE